MSTLARKRLFHGARIGWEDTHVRPPSVTGVPAISSSGYSSGSDRPPHTHMAFATHLEQTAWSYARVVPHDQEAPENNDPDPKWRSRVHEVGPAPDQVNTLGGEIESETGYPVLRTHHSEVGATSTFHEINWNAFKGRRPHSTLVDGGDMNHSYMQPDAAKPAHPPTPKEPPVFREALDGYTKKRRGVEDPRHPDQLNLFSGKTVSEHDAYNATPGVSQHLSPGQFENVAFHRDPTTSTIRRAKDYDRLDQEWGTVHA